MESRGNDKIWNPRDNEDAGNNCFGSTLHWGPYYPANGFPKTHETVCLTNGRSFADEWHTYTLDWTTEYIGRVLITISQELCDIEFLLKPITHSSKSI